jgi:FixJ family two-component response regulator
MKQTVFVIDDDMGINNALTNLFDSVGLHNQVFTSAEDFLQQYNNDDGCLVLDVRLKGMSGLMLYDQLKSSKVNLPVIFLTGHGNIKMAVNVMKQGAFDFVTKPFVNQDLLDKVHMAMLSNHNDEVLKKEQQELQRKLDRLTPRESQLLDAIVEGKQTKQIATEMGVSINTAQIHRANLMKKTGAKNLGSLINMVVKLKLSS